MKNIPIAIALKIAPAMLNAADVYFPSAISPGIIVKSTMSMMSIMIPHAVLLMVDPFYFLLLDERCDVDHNDDGEEAHKNRATDKKRNIALASCGLYCCHAWQQCHESDK